MYERMKAFLYHCINIVIAVILLGGFVGYVGISAVITTAVLNDLRLDTYMEVQTGVGIVLLILLLGWGPVLLLRNDRRR